MYKRIPLIVGYFLLCSTGHAFAALQASPAKPRIPVLPEAMHLTYSYSKTLCKWPDEALQPDLKTAQERVESLSKQPGGQRLVDSAKMDLAFYQSKRNNSTKDGVVQYWGFQRGWIWDNGQCTYIYNGKTVSSALSGALTPGAHPSGVNWLRVMTNLRDIDFEVSHLGFQQAGKPLQSDKKHSLVKTADGWEERSEIKSNYMRNKDGFAAIEVVLRYDNQGLLKSVTQTRFGNMIEETLFSNYSHIAGGLVCPRKVIKNQYLQYFAGSKQTTFLNISTKYELTDSRKEHLDDSILDVNHPPANIQVQDWRYTDAKHPNGVSYIYNNPKITLDEASRAAFSCNTAEGNTCSDGSDGTVQKNRDVGPALDKPFDFELTDVTGKPVRLKDFIGKVVVIDIWATWCGFCTREIPDLQDVQKEAGKYNIPLQIIGISIDKDASALDAYLKKQPSCYPIIRVDPSKLGLFGTIEAIPMKFIIDKKGILVQKVVDSMSANELKRCLQPYVSE